MSEAQEMTNKSDREIISTEIGSITTATSKAFSAISIGTDRHILVLPITISFATVMVDLCMAQMFSYLNWRERIEIITVSQYWYRSLRHPTTWRQDYFTHKMAASAPRWLRACLSRIDFTQTELDQHFMEMTQLRRIRFAQIYKPSYELTPREIRSALQRIKLEDLGLYEVQARDIWSALFQRYEEETGSSGKATGSECDPAVWNWESSLKTIWFANWKLDPLYPAPPLVSMFTTLTQRVWSQVESFTWNFGGEQSAETMAAFCQMLSSKYFPSLTFLQLHFLDQGQGPQGEYHKVLVDTMTQIVKSDLPKLKIFNGKFYSRNRIVQIPPLNWSALTSLCVESINDAFELGQLTQLKQLIILRRIDGSTLSLFQAIGSHSMPHLEKAILPLFMMSDYEIGGVSQADSQVVRCIMMEMKSLTSLQVSFENWATLTLFSWVTQIDALPSLTFLTLNYVDSGNGLMPTASALPQAIGALTSLKRFHVKSAAILSCHHLQMITAGWAAHASRCVIEEFHFMLTPRATLNEAEETALCATVKNLACLSHLTDLRIHRTLPHRAPTMVRRTIKDDAISSTYLPHLCALKHLEFLTVNDYHYTLTPAVLSMWIGKDSSSSTTSDNFLHLTRLQLAYSKVSSASETANLLARFPQLDFVDLFATSNSPPAVAFDAELKRLIKQQNDAGRLPKIALYLLSV